MKYALADVDFGSEFAMVGCPRVTAGKGASSTLSTCFGLRREKTSVENPWRISDDPTPSLP
jgi:hypothetical protein